jgi:hypothetical protein
VILRSVWIQAKPELNQAVIIAILSRWLPTLQAKRRATSMPLVLVGVTSVRRVESVLSYARRVTLLLLVSTVPIHRIWRLL